MVFREQFVCAIIAILLSFCASSETFAQQDREDDLLLILPAMVASGGVRPVCTPAQLRRLRANTTAEVICNLDLGGETVTVAAGTKLVLTSGTIRNGTLVFSRGRIDGELLNSSLTIVGNPALIDPVFRFYPERWTSIVQGPTNADQAFRNNEELERLFFMIRRFSGHTFVIDQFDAYFESRITPPDVSVFRAEKEAVNLPSDFTLTMSNRTHLRMFPSQVAREGGAILAVRNEENITVNGGHLHGDRDQRFYSPNDNGLEGAHLFVIRSGRNVRLNGIQFSDGSKGAIAIESFGFSFNPDYNPSQDLTIQNCVFRNNRRMSIALTDGRDVAIIGNTFINTGQPSSNSDGGEVGYAINIEPARRRDADTGELLEFQKVFDTTIRDNTETGSRSGFVTLTIGQRLTVEDNDVGTRVVTSLVSDSKVVNNRFVSPAAGGSDFAIFAAGGQSDTVFNNEVAHNFITGYETGIIAGTRDVDVHHNTITNTAVGMQIGKTVNSSFNNNSITSSSRGINITNTFNDNIEVRNNQVNAVSGFLIYLANANSAADQSEYTMLFSDNTLSGNGAVVISNIAGVDFLSNQVQGGVEVGNATNVLVSANTITPDNRHGVWLFGAHNSVEVSNNDITEPTGAARFQCVKNESETPSGLTISGNGCNE